MALWSREHVLNLESYWLGSHSKGITAIVFSPCGHFFASASYDSTAILWDSATSTPRYILETFKDRQQFPSAMNFSQNSQRLASGTSSGAVEIWNPATGKSRALLGGHTACVEDYEIYVLNLQFQSQFYCHFVGGVNLSHLLRSLLSSLLSGLLSDLLRILSHLLSDFLSGLLSDLLPHLLLYFLNQHCARLSSISKAFPSPRFHSRLRSRSFCTRQLHRSRAMRKQPLKVRWRNPPADR